jgi:hypothetical protein
MTRGPPFMETLQRMVLEITHSRNLDASRAKQYVTISRLIKLA